MIRLPLPLAIIALVTGLVMWFLYEPSIGFEIAAQISIATMMIVLGLGNIGRKKDVGVEIDAVNGGQEFLPINKK